MGPGWLLQIHGATGRLPLIDSIHIQKAVAMLLQ
jgi:hypothetical protein